MYGKLTLTNANTGTRINRKRILEIFLLKRCFFSKDFMFVFIVCLIIMVTVQLLTFFVLIFRILLTKKYIRLETVSNSERAVQGRLKNYIIKKFTN